jgi:hypothetical protein
VTLGADALDPYWFVAETKYVTAPAVAEVAVHVAPVLVQFVHVYDVGEFVHDAVRVTLVPTVGVVELAEIEHTGGDVGGAVHVTVTDALGLLPFALVATSEYVFDPAVATESLHDDVVDEQPVHVKLVGALVHAAVIVIDEPTCGDELLGVRVQDGVGVDEPPQLTVTYAIPPVPVPLLADTE